MSADYSGPTITATIQTKEDELYLITTEMNKFAALVNKFPDDVEYGHRLAEAVINFLKAAGWSRELEKES